MSDNPFIVLNVTKMKSQETAVNKDMIEFLEGQLRWARLNQKDHRSMDVRKRALAEEEKIQRELQELQAGT